MITRFSDAVRHAGDELRHDPRPASATHPHRSIHPVGLRRSRPPIGREGDSLKASHEAGPVLPPSESRRPARQQRNAWASGRRNGLWRQVQRPEPEQWLDAMREGIAAIARRAVRTEERSSIFDRHGERSWVPISIRHWRSLAPACPSSPPCRRRQGHSRCRSFAGAMSRQPLKARSASGGRNGLMPPSASIRKCGLLVVDADRHGEHDYASRHGQHHGRPWVRSRQRAAGRHAEPGQPSFFRQPADRRFRQRPRIAPARRRRAREGGYVIAPGTVMADGRVYELFGDLARHPQSRTGCPRSWRRGGFQPCTKPKSKTAHKIPKATLPAGNEIEELSYIPPDLGYATGSPC